MASNFCKYKSVYLKENLLCLTSKLCKSFREATTINWIRLDYIWRQGYFPLSTSTSHFHMPLWKKWFHPQVCMFQELIRFLIALSTIIQTTRNFVAVFLPVFAKTTLIRWMGCPIRSTSNMFWVFLGIIYKWRQNFIFFQATPADCHFIGWKNLQQREAQHRSLGSLAMK